MSEKLFVVVSKGPTPASARPVLVTENEAVCAKVARLIADELQIDQRSALRLLADESRGER